MPAKDRVEAKKITSAQLEELFDDGYDILAYVDTNNPMVEHHPPLETHHRLPNKENVFRNL